MQSDLYLRSHLISVGFVLKVGLSVRDLIKLEYQK